MTKLIPKEILIINHFSVKSFYLSLILITMFITLSATSQVIADFTTSTSNTGCGSLVVEFQDLSTGVPITWFWDFGNGNTSNLQNPTAIYSSAGIYDVSLTVTDLNSNNTKLEYSYIKVYDNPVADVSVVGGVEGCSPFVTSFEDVSMSSNIINSWLWDFGDGGSSSLQHPNYEYVNPGIYTVSLSVVDNNGCQSIATEIDLIKVNENPEANFNTNITYSCAPSENIIFSNSSVGASSYFWDFGDGTTSSLSNPTHLYSTGVYTIVLCAKEGDCIDTLILSNYLDIGNPLYPEFVTNVDDGCENLMIDFIDITDNSPDTWFWDFGDGTTSSDQNPSHNYLNPGIYDVSLTTSIGGFCSRTLTYPNRIEVFAKPDIDISFDTNYSCSTPLTVNFTDNTINAAHRNWHFSNGLTFHGSNPSVVFSNYGSYDLSLTVVNSDGCAINQQMNDLIYVDEFIIDINSDVSSGCLPLNVNFIDSIESIRPIIDWNWDFGDGSFSNIQNPSHQYSSFGSFDINLEAINDYGCISSQVFSNYISVSDLPSIDFITNSNVACVGQVVDFIDLSSSSNNITSWEWDFGDGSFSNIQNPNHQYNISGFYDVTLTASVNNCSDSLRINNYIQIVDPTAMFTEIYNCSNPFLVEFLNASTGADSVFWDFGDGTTSNSFNPIHIFSSRGSYNVVLHVTNMMTSCTHTIQKQITITIPEANFSYLVNANNNYEDSVGCTPHQVHLDNLSQDYDYFKVIWSDGYVGFGRVDHILTDTGFYDVSMIITDMHGCKDTMVYEKMYNAKSVKADFEINSTIGCDSMLVDFEDLTFPASDVLWDFGDGNTSSINNPQHTYSNSGFYDVSIYVESFFGCKDTLERIEYIQLQYPTSSFSSNVSGGCINDQIQFIDLSSGEGLQYTWDFGDGNTSNVSNPSHQFISNGFYDISLTVTDSFGCSNTDVIANYIEILNPVADFLTVGLSSNCPPLISNFSDQSTGGVVDWLWDFGDGGYTNLTNPSHLFLNSGSYNVSLIVTNHYGCVDTLIKDNLISISGPDGYFLVSDSFICQNDMVEFYPFVENTDLYFWDFGDGNFSQDSFPTHIFSDSGSFTPSLVIENSSGCQNTLSLSNSIVVRPSYVDAGVDIEVCKGENVQLNAIGNLSSYMWYPNINISSLNIFNPVVYPDTTTEYIVNHFDGICSMFDTVLVLVDFDVPIVDFDYYNTCEHDTVQFISSSGLTNNNLSWSWSFGSNLQNPQYQFNLGDNEVYLVVENLDNNCLDTLMKNIQIVSSPIALFNVENVCLGDSSYFLGNSSLDVVEFDYNINGVQISNSSSFNHLFSNPGVYNISLNVVSENGCVDDLNSSFEIYEIPNVDFIVENNCEGDSNMFVNISTINTGEIDDLLFDFGDGNFSNDSISFHKYDSSGIYNVNLTVFSNYGCQSDTSYETLVYSNPEVDFYVSDFCLGSQTYFVDSSFVDNGNIVQWIWSFNDSSFYHNHSFSYYFTDSKVYNIDLEVMSSYGCFSSISKQIYINKLPNIEFTCDTLLCLGDESSFYDLSVSSNSDIVNWIWNLGDGTLSFDKNPIHSYLYPSSFSISLEVKDGNGCKKDTTIYNMVTVLSMPIADFETSDMFVTELNSDVQFINRSENASLYFWDFGNGEISTDENPKFDFYKEGNYTVVLKSENEYGCYDETEKVIYVYPEYNIYIPSAFSPNGDGLNDIFRVKGRGIIDYRLEIYDRWGGMVFESINVDEGWDGSSQDFNYLENGNYLYHISIYDYRGKTWVYNGELKLIR